MKKNKETELDFVIDQLTNSIINVVTGDTFQTDISIITKNDLKLITKKNKWEFNWNNEFKYPDREVYKLTIVNNPLVIQGLICLEIRPDHVYMHLIESAPFNRGKTKVYIGVAGNLVAFACKLSFQRGFDGNLSFLSKTKLIEHYVNSLGAVHIGSSIMVIETPSALKLINKYFKITSDEN